jgi:hypothetical protein
MTEMVNGEGQGSSNFAGVPVTPSSTQSNAPAEVERTFKQSEVNDLVGRARNEAVERYRRESSMASHQAPQTPTQPVYQQPYQQPYQAPPPQSRTLSEDDYRRVAAEEAQRSRNEWIQESHRNAEEQNAQRIASEFFTKIDAGKGNLQDFDKVMADIDLRSIPYHVQLANMVDNTAEVMYELAKNPSKIGAIQNLIDIDIRAGRQPKLALSEMKRLSDSIKTNQKAANFKSPNEPLSQMRPSNAGTGNQGERSVRDYRNNPAYRV